MLYPEGPKPKNPWPWGLGLCFAAFITFQISLVRMASNGFEGPDQVQYYRMGLEHSKELERQKVQRRLGWKLEKPFPEQLTPQRHSWRTRMLAPGGADLNGTLTLRFKRPATKTQDFQVESQSVDGWLYCQFELQPGWWVVELEFLSGGQKWLQHQRCFVSQAGR